MKKLICVLLVLAIAFSAAGCGRMSCSTESGSTPEPTAQQSTESITEKPGPDASAAPTNTPDPDADAAFEKLDKELFAERINSSYVTYNQFVVSDGARFGADPEQIPMTWGDLTYEAHTESIELARDMLERLSAIDPDMLSESNRYAYDALKRSFEMDLMFEDYYYFDEPLKPLNGCQTLVPLSLILMNIRTLKDVEAYMAMTEDIERFFDQVGKYESEKAEKGLFMCETALDQVIDSLRSFASKGSGCFLITCFDKVADRAKELGMSDSECAELTTRNAETVLMRVLPAYNKLADTLEAHRKDCTEFTGAANRSPEELKYFELQTKYEGATMDGMDRILELMEKMGKDTLSDLYLAVVYGSDALLEKYGTPLSLGSVDDNIAWLKEFVKQWYPQMPEYSLRYVDVPEDIADGFSPAAYIEPAYDDYYDNVILINRSSEGSDDMFALAHEAIPGHMYQFLNARNTPGMPLSQQANEPTGYAEAWTVFTESFVSKRCFDIGLNYCTLMNCENTISSIFLPEYISIKVNREGWSEADVRRYLGEMELEDAADIYYEYAVTMPFYAASYAIGYSYIYSIYQNAAPDTPEDHKAFFERYLSYGPTYMDILMGYMAE